MNRRNVLIGLGGVVAGGGALIGTGAFDTVEAERTVTVETAGDADAFLALEPADEDDDDGFVTVEDDLIEIDITGEASDEADDDDGGLNQRAVTTFNELVDLTNQGTQDLGSITLEIVPEGENDVSGVFSYPVSSDDVDVNDGTENGGDILDDNLEPGDSLTFGLIVDLLNNDADGDPIHDLDDVNYNLTITAEAADE